jgi:hypothetical protein
MEAVEQARAALEREGPSAELALAYIRIAGFHAFRLDYDLCRVAAERGAEIAEQASADFERVWALSFLALGWFGTAKEFELFSQIYEESIEKGYSIIAGNTIHNEIWDRVHTLAGGTREAVQRYDRVSFLARTIGAEISKSWADLARGEPRKALEQARLAIERHESLGNPKFEWRSHLAAVEALLELGRTSEAAEELPPPSPGKDLQDIVYDTPAQVGVAVALGRREEAAELGRRASSNDEPLRVRGTVTYAVEGLLEGGLLRRPKPCSAGRGARPSSDRLGRASEGGFCSRRASRLRLDRSSSERLSRSSSPSSRSGRGVPRRLRPTRPLSPAMTTERVLCSPRASATPTARARFARDAALAVAERFGLEVPPVEDRAGLRGQHDGVPQPASA